MMLPGFDYIQEDSDVLGTVGAAQGEQYAQWFNKAVANKALNRANEWRASAIRAGGQGDVLRAQADTNAGIWEGLSGLVSGVGGLAKGFAKRSSGSGSSWSDSGLGSSQYRAPTFEYRSDFRSPGSWG